MPLSLSVALCTFEGSRFIEQQVHSILRQRPLPSQIVVSDDGSSDDTVEIVTRLLAGVDQYGISVSILRGPGLGITANFAHAIGACTGDLVMLCDQDDVWREGRVLESVEVFARDAGLQFESSDARLVDGAGEPTGMTLFAALPVSEAELAAVQRGDAFSVLLRRNLATGATVTFRRELFDVASPLPADWLHDEWLAIIAAATGRVAISRSQRVDYRQHADNQVGVRPPTLVYRLGRLLRSEPDRNAILSRRSNVLRDRLIALGVSPAIAVRANAKVSVESARASMPKSWFRRVPTIARLLFTGAYARYTSQGHLEALRDLLRK